MALLFVVGLSACSGGGGSDTDTPTTSGITVSGVVTAPAGQVAKLQEKPLVYALLDHLFPSAEASVTGVSIVPNTTVTALRVDGSGNVVATLGNTTTDARGHYALRLPSGTALAPTIILRVQGSGIQLRAPAVQTLVDITPASEWLLQEVQGEGVTLDTLDNDDLLFLQAVLEGYTVNAGGDVATTLSNLAPLHALIAAEIAAVKASTTTPPSFDGTWVMSGNDIMVGNVSSIDNSGLWISGQWLNTLSDYTATLTHTSGNSYNVSLSGYESETSQYAHGSNCAFSATQPYVTGCTFQGYNWSGDGFYEAKSFGPVAATQQLFALDDGRVVLPYPAQETIEAGDIFGYITPPYVEVLMPMGGTVSGGADAYAGIATWPTFAYALTSDGQAADRTQLRGGSGDMKPMALIKQGSGLGNDTLNGRFAYVALNHDLASDGDRTHSVFFGTLDADGSGALGNGTITGAELARTVNNGYSAALTGSPLSAAITGNSYGVSSNGALTLNLATDAPNQPPALTGRVNGAGNFFYASAAEADTVSTPQRVVHTSVFGIKVESTAPQLSGRSYRFRASDLQYGAGNYASYSHLAYSTLTFTDTSNVTLTLNSQALDRSDDITAIASHPATMGEVVTGTYLTANNGGFTVALADGTVIRGHVNAKSMLAIHYRGIQASGPVDLTASSGAVGIAMGRCASNC